MPNISKLGMEMPSSPIRRLAPYAMAAKQRGLKVYHLNIGQPDIKTPEAAIEAVRNIKREVLEYSPSDGFLSLREKMVDYYKKFQIDVTPDDVVITVGGSEALMLAFMSCLNPGEEVIMSEPAYANYKSLALMSGVVIRPIPSFIDDGFALPSIEKFEEMINERTRGILICSPSNPAGYLYTREELNRIRDLVKKHDLYLFSDEVYREFAYTDQPYTSACHLEGIEENVVMIDSMSKRYSACGIRIGALVTKNKALRATVMKFCQARLSPPLLGQIVAEASIDAPQEYTAHTYKEYIARRDCLMEELGKIEGVYSPVPMGAFYTIARLPIDDSDKFCEWCLREFEYEGATVMLAPASGFYSEPGLGKTEVRIAYVLEKDELRKAVRVLKEAIETYNKLRE